MSLYNVSGLPFWDESAINMREHHIRELYGVVRNELLSINPAWSFERCEAPIITPREFISPNYTADDIFELNHPGWGNNRKSPVLRAETTPGSYEYARCIMSNGWHVKRKPIKAPLCVWQAGKSFRVEKSDGATAAKLRFNEFYQLEFQCIYSRETGADYHKPVEIAVAGAIKTLTGSSDVRLVESDRLPSYSVKTMDVEVPWNNSFSEEWREMASISKRTDFSEQHYVLEVAVGLDRLLMVNKANEFKNKFNLALDKG